MDKEETLEGLKEKGIPLPPTDCRCQICNKIHRNKTLSLTNGKWVCVYMECHDKAKNNKEGKE